jgi:hypothetical protein
MFNALPDFDEIEIFLSFPGKIELMHTLSGVIAKYNEDFLEESYRLKYDPINKYMRNLYRDQGLPGLQNIDAAFKKYETFSSTFGPNLEWTTVIVPSDFIPYALLKVNNTKETFDDFTKQNVLNTFTYEDILSTCEKSEPDQDIMEKIRTGTMDFSSPKQAIYSLNVNHPFIESYKPLDYYIDNQNGSLSFVDALNNEAKRIKFSNTLPEYLVGMMDIKDFCSFRMYYDKSGNVKSHLSYNLNGNKVLYELHIQFESLKTLISVYNEIKECVNDELFLSDPSYTDEELVKFFDMNKTGWGKYSMFNYRLSENGRLKANQMINSEINIETGNRYCDFYYNGFYKTPINLKFLYDYLVNCCSADNVEFIIQDDTVVMRVYLPIK